MAKSGETEVIETDKVEPKRKIGALNRQHVKLEASARRNWCVTPPYGARPEDLCEPDYWRHLAQEIGIAPNDKVCATCEGGEWYAEYLVIHVGPQHAKLSIINKVKLASAEDVITTTQTHEIKWMGPSHKFVVIRLSDGVTMEKGFANKEAAAKWMMANQIRVAA